MTAAKTTTKTEENAVPQIYGLINQISNEAGALAPQKGGGIPFAFRGVDAVVNHVSPLMRKYGVIVVPEVQYANHSAREVGSKVVTQTDLLTKFTFIAPDGSSVSTVTSGLAQDFADRSAAQAQSVAFRVAILQIFTLPTTDKEPEANGEEIIKGIAEEKARVSASTASKPSGPNVNELTQQIKKLISGEFTDSKGTVLDAVPATKIDALGDKISGKSGAAWKRDPKVLQQVIAEVTR